MRTNRLVALAIAVILGGCATVSEGRFTYCDVKNGQGKALDVRAGEHWYNRLLASPHHMTSYRKEDGTCELVIEQANPDTLSEISGPLGSVVSHTTIPIVP